MVLYHCWFVLGLSKAMVDKRNIHEVVWCFAVDSSNNYRQ